MHIITPLIEFMIDLHDHVNNIWLVRISKQSSTLPEQSVPNLTQRIQRLEVDISHFAKSLFSNSVDFIIIFDFRTGFTKPAKL